MIKLLLNILISVFLIYQINANTISELHFLPNSSIFPGGRDGIVVATLNTGEKTSICNYKFTEIEASIVCKSLGYPPNGLSIITDQHYTKGNVFLGNFQCKGNEIHLKHCLHSGRTEFKGSCGAHHMDVHVYCLENKISTDKAIDITTCKKSSGISLLPLPGKINTGFLQLQMNEKSNYVCNDDFTFGVEAASFYCKTICTNANYSRPLMFLDRTGFEINENSSFVRSSCISGSCSATKIETCDPSYVVGLKCGDEPIIIEKSPNILCNNENMTIIWKNYTIPTINSKLVKFTFPCANATVYDNVYGDVILSTRLGDCDPIIKDEMDYVSYTYIIQRSYKPVGLTLQNSANLTAQCQILKRNQITNKMEFMKITPFPLNFNTKVSTKMEIFSDESLTIPMDVSNKVDFRKLLFVKVSIINPPKDIKLNLNNCVVSPDEKFDKSNTIFLIQDMCPNKLHDVQLTYLNRFEISFQFQPFNFVKNQDMLIYIKCKSSKCYFPKDPFCGVCKQKSRIKRSITPINEHYNIFGPIMISNNKTGHVKFE